MADPTWIPEVLRKAGLICDEFPGWRNRGHGDFGWIWGILDHHTGSFGETPNGIANHPSLGLASQLYLGKDGKYTMCGAGIAWHAGTGSWQGIPTNNANQCTIGIEAANDGTSGWSAAQYGAYIRGNAAILNHLGLDSSHSIGHKEWGAIQGKWDPGKIDMKAFRRDIAAAQKGTVAPIVNLIELEAKENPWVGARHGKAGVAGETVVGADRKGRFVEYENAHIYFHPACGAHAIPHEGLFEGYSERKWERGELGYPVRDFTKLPEGAVMSFQGGILYRKDGKEDFVVKGIIGQRWAKEGYEKGQLGWPVSDEVPNGTGGNLQQFENGTLEWDPSGAVKEIGHAATDLTIVDSNGLPKALDAVKQS